MYATCINPIGGLIELEADLEFIKNKTKNKICIRNYQKCNF